MADCDTGATKLYMYITESVLKITHMTCIYYYQIVRQIITIGIYAPFCARGILHHVTKTDLSRM